MAQWRFLSTSSRVLKWQTLQDVTSPIVPPYDRMPQLAMRYVRNDNVRNSTVGGRRRHPISERQQPDRATQWQRAFSRLQISRPWVSAAGFHHTQAAACTLTNYQFNAPLANGATSASRTVPSFSLDSGLVFDRDTQLFGRAFRQTLEPRAFYVQHAVFATRACCPTTTRGANDFNLPSIYTENALSAMTASPTATCSPSVSPAAT
jgi:LPS-assembly protein